MKKLDYEKFVDVWIETGSLIDAAAAAGSVSKNRRVLSSLGHQIKIKKEVIELLNARLGEEFESKAQTLLYISRKISKMNDCQKTKAVRVLKKLEKDMSFSENQLEKMEG